MTLVKENQSIFDIAVQEYGQIDNVIKISSDNDVSISENLETNTDLDIDATGAGNNDIKKVIKEESLSMNNKAVSPIVIYSDWFLPSRNELNEMYIALKVFGVGGFGSNSYWSSSEDIATKAFFQFFGDGTQGSILKSNSRYVRAARKFTSGIGAYSLRDVGPAGGLIFYISGTTYYEAAPSDQSSGQVWSNIGTVLIGTTGTAIGAGIANTAAIIAQSGHTDSAAKLCNDLVI